MLLRRDGDGLIAIGQPAHAWVSGQLARAWGDEAFGAVEPWEEVCLAAEQHDIGMAAWERQPSFNAETGLPRSFMELTLDEHLGMWSAAAGPRAAPEPLRRAARLDARHRALRAARPHAAERGGRGRVRAFMAAQRALQDELRASLGADEAPAPQPAARLDLGLALARPAAALAAVVAARGADGAGEPDVAVGHGTLDPWPFAAPRLSLRCEGRRLRGPYPDEEAMRAALAAAPWVTLEIELERREAQAAARRAAASPSRCRA